MVSVCRFLSRIKKTKRKTSLNNDALTVMLKFKKKKSAATVVLYKNLYNSDTFQILSMSVTLLKLFLNPLTCSRVSRLFGPCASGSYIRLNMLANQRTNQQTNKSTTEGTASINV